MKERKFDIKKFTSWTILLFVPLLTYPIFMNSVTLGDLLLIFNLIFVILSLFREKNRSSFPTPMLLYITMLLVMTLFHWLLGIGSISEEIFSILRYLLYLSYCLIVSKRFIDFNYTYNSYKKLSVILAIYVFLQFVSFYLFRHILPINILSIFGLKTFESVYWYDNITRYAGNLILYRPCSVFVEPAHYAVYQSPILYLLINNIVDDNKNNIKFSLIILISILLSGSTTGIVIILFCFLKRIGNMFKKSLVKTLILAILIIVVGYAFINSDYGARVIDRTFSEESNGAINGRFSEQNIVFSENNSHLIIGNGMSYEENIYLPSYQRLFLSFGVIGFVIFVISMLFIFGGTNVIGKKLLILYLLTMFGTMSLFGTTLLLFFPLILTNYRNTKNINN